MPEIGFKAQIEDVLIPIEQHQHLNGLLTIPEQSRGLVLFAHGSGSSRLSKRNQFVASVLHEANIATLLFDLLTNAEEHVDEYNRSLRFNIDLLADRLIAATHWTTGYQKTADHTIGYFGASTGGAAAIVAAAKIQPLCHAVVSRGGRPDLAGDFLEKLTAPTLLIVGGLDGVVIDLNNQAYGRMHCIKRIEIVPGATHLFEEPGTLESVASLASLWFSKHL